VQGRCFVLVSRLEISGSETRRRVARLSDRREECHEQRSIIFLRNDDRIDRHAGAMRAPALVNASPCCLREA
jgi:hypothetical protein